MGVLIKSFNKLTLIGCPARIISILFSIELTYNAWYVSTLTITPREEPGISFVHMSYTYWKWNTTDVAT